MGNATDCDTRHAQSPPAWAVETWKPTGGCKFTGYFSGAAGNSALRFCLLLKWRAIRPQATELFTAQLQGDSLSCLPAEFDDTDVETASTPSSDTSAKRADRLAQAIESDSTQGSQAPDPRPCTPCPQQLSPPLFVPWSQVAQLRGVVAVHTDIEACPHEELQVALEHPQCLVPGEKEHLLQVNSDLLLQLRGTIMPLEGIAPQVFEAIYQRQQGEILWVTVLWMIAQLNDYRVRSTSHHCRQYFKSIVVAWEVEPLKGSPSTFIARVRQSEKVKSMGRHFPPLMSLPIKNGGLPMAGRPECMKLPPSLRSHRIRAKNGKL